jgi:hypothetical protein
MEGLPEGLQFVRFGQGETGESVVSYDAAGPSVHACSSAYRGYGAVVTIQPGYHNVWDGEARKFVIVRDFNQPKAIEVLVKNPHQERRVLELIQQLATDCECCRKPNAPAI